MEDSQIEHDYLNFSNDQNIKANITKEESIQFSDKIIKINKLGTQQKRNIIITDKGIYNLKKTELKKRIDIKAIKNITLSKETDEFEIHFNKKSKYKYISAKKKTIVEIIAKNYYNIKNEELKLFEVNLSSLSTLVSSNNEKNITNSESLYEEIEKEEEQKEEAELKETNEIIENKKIELDNLEIIKTIGRGSVGKILLARYKNTGDLYAIKSMRKDQLLSKSLIDNILIEKIILSEGQCQFILQLLFFFQTPERLYFITPFMKGGDLYHKLKVEGYLSENLVRFYTAQIAIALQHLHDSDIVYGDLKPENILIDEDGYIKLCDFGASMLILDNKKEKSFVGIPEYASPEMIAHEGYDIMSDWWSFGILIYELLFGITPFFNIDIERMYELIEIGEVKFPKTIKIGDKFKTINVSNEAKNIIIKLLEKNPDSRLGKNGLKEIQNHPFFNKINFDMIKSKKLDSPFKPKIVDSDLAYNFDEEFTSMDIKESPVADWISDYPETFNDFEGDADE